jgi:TolB-like protein
MGRAVAGESKAVFLSYASEDSEAAARIAEALRESGIEVWFDQRELRGGDAWDRTIRRQIRDCRLFVPIISANTEARGEGYFRREWKLAADRTDDMASNVAFLVPVVIDGTPDRSAEVPERFRQVQWTRLPGGNASAPFVDRISALLGGAIAAVPTSGPGVTRTIANQSPGPRRRLLTIALASLTLVLGAGAIWLAVRHAHTREPSIATAVTDRSIAVLPFVDMSEQHNQEYFADGMAEEILNLLVKVPDLKVIGRTSSFQFKGIAEDLRQIGTTLGAAYVVEGSVRRSGNHLRVTTQLIDTRSGTHRWSETFDREAADTLQVQGEIAASLVRALQLEVASSSFLQGRVLPTSPEVYDAYLRGLHAFNRFDQAGMEEAVANYRRALRLDPGFVPAAEQLARTLCDQPSWGFVPPRIGYEQARAAADAALKLDSKSAIARAVLGCVHIWYDWDWAMATQEVNSAIALSPNDPFVLVTAADEHLAVGKSAESLSLCEAGLSTDPLLSTLYQNAAWAYMALGRFQEAARALRRVLDISPTYVQAHHDLGVALLLGGNPQEALSEIQKETPEGGRSAGLVLAYQALHRGSEADAELARLETEHGADMAMWIAEAHAFRGDRDQAFAWLERAYAQKDIFLWTAKSDPLLKSLERDARFKAFLRKMNLAG